MRFCLFLMLVGSIFPALAQGGELVFMHSTGTSGETYCAAESPQKVANYIKKNRMVKIPGKMTMYFNKATSNMIMVAGSRQACLNSCKYAAKNGKGKYDCSGIFSWK